MPHPDTCWTCAHHTEDGVPVEAPETWCTILDADVALNGWCGKFTPEVSATAAAATPLQDRACHLCTHFQTSARDGVDPYHQACTACSAPLEYEDQREIDKRREKLRGRVPASWDKDCDSFESLADKVDAVTWDVEDQRPTGLESFIAQALHEAMDGLLLIESSLNVDSDYPYGLMRAGIAAMRDSLLEDTRSLRAKVAYWQCELPAHLATETVSETVF